MGAGEGSSTVRAVSISSTHFSDAAFNKYFWNGYIRHCVLGSGFPSLEGFRLAITFKHGKSVLPWAFLRGQNIDRDTDRSTSRQQGAAAPRRNPGSSKTHRLRMNH